MRRLGFKTFSDFWDESYDSLSMADRIRGITQVLATISSWSPEELVSKLAAMKPILDHNFTRFLQLTQQQIADTFNE
jgi:N-acetylglucosamine-6-phosphate deacetylase